MKSIEIEYLFSDVQPFPGLSVHVSGSADIKARYHKPDPSVGIFEGSFDFEVVRISIEGTNGNPDHNLDVSHPLYAPIEDALTSNPHSYRIEEELDESFNEEN